MKSKKFVVPVSLSLLAAATLAGCKAAPATAPFKPVQAIQQRQHSPQELAQEELTLFNNKFFLWPEQMTSDTVKRTLQIAKQIDDLDTEAFSLASEISSLEQTMAPVRQVDTRIRGIDTALNRVRNDIRREERAPTPNETRLAQLRAQQAEREAELDQARQERVVVLNQIDPEGRIRARLEQEIPQRLEAIGAEGTERVEEITQLVYWYRAQPEKVLLRFEPNAEGQLAPVVSIKSWALYADGEPEADKLSFSSKTDLEDYDGDGELDDDGEAGTIANVEYRAKGGVFRFDLGVFVDKPLMEPGLNPAKVRAAIIEAAMKGQVWDRSLKEVYRFRIGRTNYSKTDDAKDGRIFFAGEMNRYRDPNGAFCSAAEREQARRKNETPCVRQGSAKLVDRNN